MTSTENATTAVKSPKDYRAIEFAPVPVHRRPQPAEGFSLPAGTIVVSADNHFSISEDIFIDRFPKHLKDKAPRVWRDEDSPISHMGFNGQSLVPKLFYDCVAEDEAVVGCHDFVVRESELRAEGVDKEIAFPQLAVGLLFVPDYEVREWALRAYNQYLSELQERMPGYFYGVGLANYWEPRRAREVVSEIKSLGLKTFMLPLNAGNFPGGAPISYASHEMDDFWSAVEEDGLPVCFHIGETGSIRGRGAFGANVIVNRAPFRKIVGELIFGGVLDRFPGLRIVFAEGGINWMASALQDVEDIVSKHPTTLDWNIKNIPEHYFRNNFYATFIDDDLGLQLINRIGVDRAMWSNDFPHHEGSFGSGRSVMQKVIDAVGSSGARQILGGNAMEVFKLD